MSPADYVPVNALSLWYLGNPTRPALVGTLTLVLTGARGVSLRYAPSWRQTGFPPSEDLPLLDLEHLPNFHVQRDEHPG